jgi:hypothetical protein
VAKQATAGLALRGELWLSYTIGRREWVGGGASGKGQERVAAVALYTRETRAPGFWGVRAHGCDGRRDVASIKRPGQAARLGGPSKRTGCL